jgi:DNA repair photolyase
MTYKEIDCQSVVRRFTAPDLYFHGMYGVDVYQNCAFSCRYCDSSYDSMIYVCRNAIDVLVEEIKDMPIGQVVIGSVHDPYQPVEQSIGLVRQVITLLISKGFSVHVLTKSPLVLRDVDILKKSEMSMVTMSMVSLDADINQRFEPNVPEIYDRLQAVQQLVDTGVTAGVAIFPVLPFLVENSLPVMVNEVKQFHALYVVYKHLELKGDLKHYYFRIIRKYYPDILDKYEKLYNDRYSPSTQYIKHLEVKMQKLCESVGISCGIPMK